MLLQRTVKAIYARGPCAGVSSFGKAETAGNCSKLLETAAGNCSKLFETAGNCWKLLETAEPHKQLARWPWAP
eukprot:9570549-Alexandrium_andersonii.AAC.1